MPGEKNVGHLERILSGVAERPREKPASYWTRSYAVIRRRIGTGVLFLIPIATTLWFLNFFLGSIYSWFEQPLRPILSRWGMDPEGAAYKAVGLAMSLVAVLALLYIFGLITQRTAVRRLITLVERLVERIPFVKFFYKTSKQIVETVAMPSKGGFKKVVLIDFPSPGIKTLAFATGETPVAGSPEPYVNVFVAMGPNPTAGYIIMLPRSQVLETDLPIEKGFSFIISGGILAPDMVTCSPYQAPATLPASSAPAPEV